jgi:hypothetical protein
MKLKDIVSSKFRNPLEEEKPYKNKMYDETNAIQASRLTTTVVITYHDMCYVDDADSIISGAHPSTICGSKYSNEV